MNQEDMLQQRLARLEAGESLEACLAGLPGEDADLLRVAAALGSIPYPSRTAGQVAAQRANLLRAARGLGKNVPSKAPQAASRFSSNGSVPVAWRVPLMLAGAGVLIVMLMMAAVVLHLISSSLSTAQGTLPGSGSSPVVVPTSAASSAPLMAPDPQSAVIADARGLVELQTGDGKWSAVRVGQVIRAGQRVRTRNLSGATLLFYDKSQARLGPMTEASVDKLDAQVNGARVVQLTQWTGETDHNVTPSSNAGSQYKVNTPNGSGAAQGTSFHVSVSSSQITRISVEEGSVAATNLNITVIVIAGQVTTIHIGAPPEQPVFRVSGVGIVTQMGSTWRIGGQEFRTDANTLIVGNPQLGDLVAVEGHLLDDGTCVADRIVLLRRAADNRFDFTGTVSSIQDTQWTISGRTVRVNRDTVITPGIKTGDLVEVDGILQPDGTLLAEHIRLAGTLAGLPFEFTGLVQSVVSKTWTISGVSVTVDANTHIDAGLAVGDLVRVQGRILPNGTWLAASIQRALPQERRFEFTGVVQSIAPWVVSGIGFQTDDQTEIEAGVKVGDRARVQGRVLDDGVWLAEEIARIDDSTLRFEIVGRVTRINPWIIAGVPISVTAQTLVDSGIKVGDLVRAEGRVLADGTWLAETIRRLDTLPECTDTFGVVIQVEGGQIVLQNGQTIRLGPETQIKVKVKGKDKGDKKIEVGSSVIVHICTNADGAIVVVSITIIQLPEGIPPSNVPPQTGLCINPAGKIMPCPPGNPPSFRRLDGSEGGGKNKPKH